MKTREELIAIWTRQLELRDADMEEVVLCKRRKRMEGKEAFDSTKRMRAAQIEVGDVVLRHDAKSLTGRRRGSCLIGGLGCIGCKML